MSRKITDKAGLVTSHDLKLDNDYIKWICELKQRFRSAQMKAAVKVNSVQLLFNWQLGRDLVSRRAEEKWGKGVVEQVSLDLQAEFPNIKGFSTSNLWYMKKWYQFYEPVLKSKKLQQLVGEIAVETNTRLEQIGTAVEETQHLSGGIGFPTLFSYVPWGHHVLIITKCKDVEEALFYIKLVIDKGLSRKALDDYIRSDYYKVHGNALTNFQEKLSVTQGKLAQELLKSNYNLGFVSLPEEYNENDLEDVLEQRMTRFLLELGEGWAFVGRQREIIISGKTRRIDLLFYHIYLRCYVVLELKVKPFDPEFAGKLNFYVNAVNEYVKKGSDNPTIGLLICKGMDRTEVQLAFQGITTPMGVATYDNVRIKEIQEYLPTTEQIRQQIALAEEEYKHKLRFVTSFEKL